jgi:CheY-like chemotaxis protein
MTKVLIVDDDPAIRHVFRDIVHAGFEGTYELREASSRAEGTKILHEFEPDLVVLDVMMEQPTSGFKMAKEIRCDQQLKHTKILMLTNIDEEVALDFQKYAGDSDWLPVDAYIVKPIDPKKMLATLEELIGK